MPAPTFERFCWILTSKVGQTDLIFGQRSGLVNTLDYKPVCAAVTICAILVDGSFDFYILTPVTSKSRSNQK